MATTLPLLSAGYLAALKRYLKREAVVDFTPARRLGKRALRLNMETLQMARMHEEALITLLSPQDTLRQRQAVIRRAGAFFAEAMAPVEETHRGAIKANLELEQAVKRLTQRTVELSTANGKLTKEVARRKVAEVSLRASEQSSRDGLKNAQRLQGELKQLSRQLLSTQEEERMRISRELHDVIAQTLSGINLRLASLNVQAQRDTAGLARQIATTQRLVEKSVDIVHRFAQDLRPPVLDHLGLVPALRSYMTSFLEKTGIRVGVTASATLETLDIATRTVLYRVVQEALVNVARHAKASQASVVIQQTAECLRLEVRDNGIGFLPSATSSLKGRTPMGVLGMRERVEMIGGTFTVGGGAGEGTTILVKLYPVRQSTRKQNLKKTSPPLLQTP